MDREDSYQRGQRVAGAQPQTATEARNEARNGVRNGAWTGAGTGAVAESRRGVSDEVDLGPDHGPGARPVSDIETDPGRGGIGISVGAGGIGERSDLEPGKRRGVGEGMGIRASARAGAGAMGARMSGTVPPTLRGALLDPGRRAVGALALVGVVAAVFAVAYLWQSRPQPVPLAPRQVVSSSTSPVAVAAGKAPPVPAGAAPSGQSPAVTAASPGVVVVDVGGKVQDPGVYTLSAGSRVIDAVEAAGGVTDGADTTGVNLARPLVDGEKILVGVPRPVGLSGPRASGAQPAKAAPGTGQVLDLNTATARQLEQLPGIGPVLSERIIDYRVAHGDFDSVAELMDVSGIGDATLEDLRGQVRV